MPDYSWSDTLGALAARRDIGETDAHAAMGEIMGGRATEAQIAAFIVALRLKGETADEMAGLVRGMREASLSVDLGGDGILDIVGTGGDGSGTFNISTTASLIAAGAGARIAKHGNRSMSSKCGSADVLEHLGVRIDLEPDANQNLFRSTGYAFFLAPVYHPAMRFAGPVRRQLGIPTVFNFLGPLSNPAGATTYAVGVSDGSMAERMINVLAKTGATRAFVYHGDDGLDELTTTGHSIIWRLVDGDVTRAEFTPEDFGVTRARVADLLGGEVEQNAAILRSVLAGEPGPKRDIAVVNASAGLVAAGLADGFAAGIELAKAAIDDGRAQAKLDEVIARSEELASAGS